MSASDDLRTLETTADAAERNTLALKLAELKTPGLDAVLARLIQRPDLADKRGTLVHALGYLDCSDHVGLLVELVLTADFEVAHEALQALETVEEAGQLVLTDWCGDYLMCRLFERYQRLRAHAHVRTYRTHECARMLKESGYAAVQIETYKINWLWGLMTARGTHVQA